MNKFGLMLSGFILSGSSLLHAQLSASIKINEVMTNNTTSLQDEYGTHKAWIEIANCSYSTYNIRGMYLTTNRAVLDRTMSVPKRIALMSIIPNEEPRTMLSARQHIVFYCNSNQANGNTHLNVHVNPSKPTWIALYDGNGVDLIDSVTIPVLGKDMSFARKKDGSNIWQIQTTDAVTPGISNYIEVNESKVAKLKREDPYGLGITILAMGIVFSCLTLLFLAFSLIGLIMKHRATAKKVANAQPIKPITRTVEKTVEIGHKTNIILQDGLKSKGIDKEVYIAVIGMALKQYQDDVHDIESGIITIKPKNTDWNDEFLQMTQFHEFNK